jgi:hypothetical protein
MPLAQTGGHAGPYHLPGAHRALSATTQGLRLLILPGRTGRAFFAAHEIFSAQRDPFRPNHVLSQVQLDDGLDSMTIASVILANFLFFGVAYLAISRLTGGMLPRTARVRHADVRRRGANG